MGRKQSDMTEQLHFHCNTFVVVVFVQSCWTLCSPRNCSMQGFLVLHYLLAFAQTHVHWVDDAIQPSHPLLILFLLPSIFHSIRVFSNELALCIRWPKYWSFSFNISPSSEYSGLINMLIFQNINKNVLMFILHVHKWHVNFRLETTMFSVAISKWNVFFLLHFSSRSCITAPEF